MACRERAMNRSHNEVEMTIQKACRGAGLDIGQAQGVAKIIACQATPDVLRAMLQDFAAPVPPLKISMSPLVCGNPWISRDFLGLADAALSGHEVTIMGCSVTPYVNALARGCGVNVTGQASGFTMARTTRQPLAAKRADIYPSLWDEILGWAAKTYVPESAESRISGAGAGLNDND